MNWLVNRLGLKYLWLRSRLTGSPSLLIKLSHFVDEHTQQVGVHRDEVIVALREHDTD